MSARRYRLPSGATVRTSATRRFLVIGHYDGARPAVETTTDTRADADRLAYQYRRDYPHTAWYVVDQDDGAS